MVNFAQRIRMPHIWLFVYDLFVAFVYTLSRLEFRIYPSISIYFINDVKWILFELIC